MMNNILYESYNQGYRDGLYDLLYENKLSYYEITFYYPGDTLSDYTGTLYVHALSTNDAIKVAKLYNSQIIHHVMVNSYYDENNIPHYEYDDITDGTYNYKAKLVSDNKISQIIRQSVSNIPIIDYDGSIIYSGK